MLINRVGLVAFRDPHGIRPLWYVRTYSDWNSKNTWKYLIVGVGVVFWVYERFMGMNERCEKICDEKKGVDDRQEGGCRILNTVERIISEIWHLTSSDNIPATRIILLLRKSPFLPLHLLFLSPLLFPP
jgi:hypothetical protein